MRCEWEPDKQELALLTDKYHGEAEYLSGHGINMTRLCRNCARLKRFRNKKLRVITNEKH